MMRRGSSLLSSLLRPKERVTREEIAALESASLAQDATRSYGAARTGSSLIDAELTETFGVPNAPAGALGNEQMLESFNEELLKLVNLTQSTLTRAMRPQLGGKVESNLGPLTKGLEIAERIEQRARGLLLETSLTVQQRPRVLCATQNAQDQSVALRASRYIWQTCGILASIPGGNGTFARVKRLVGTVTELNGKVASVLETGQGNERTAAAEVAAQYRQVLTEQAEILVILRNDIAAPPLARRLGRAAVTSLVIAAESMTRVAARLAYPESASHRSAVPERPGLNDGILRPLPPR